MNKPATNFLKNIPSLLSAVFLFALPASSAVLPSAGEYQLAASVVDNGGGANLTGGSYSVKGAIGQNNLPPNRGNAEAGEYSNRTGFNNPPHFSYQGGLPATLTMASGDMSLTLPSESVDKTAFDITLNKNPENQPLAVDPLKITDANEKIVYNDGSWAQLYPNNLSEMAIFDEQSFYSKPLAKRGIMNLRYKDANNDGILDGSYPPVRVDTLNAWILDESVNSWVQVRGGGVDKDTKMLTVYFGMPGVYALLGAQDTSVVNVKAYPVPFRPNGPQSGIGQGQTGTEAAGITFDNLPQTGNISIFTLDGRLVKKFDIQDTLGIAKLYWDVKTSSGEKAASGVYIWRVVSGSNSKTGKLMVIW